MALSILASQPKRPVEALGFAAHNRAGLKRRRLRALRQNLPALFGLTVLALLVLTAVSAPLIAPRDPITQRLTDRLLPPVWLAGGSADHVLGTDQLGRDVLSRIIWGARPSLALGFVASTLSLVLGVVLGLVAGLTPRSLGVVIMRAADAQLAFPAVVAFIAVVGVFGSSFLLLVFLLSLFGWAGVSKVTCSQVLSVKHREYVEAARLIGAGPVRIALQHILPNIASPLLVLYTFSVAQVILIEAALSFLGLGIQPPTPAWGSMLAEGQTLLDTAWWLGTFPGLAIILTVLAVNVVGDALRDLFDPRLVSQF
jgi:peptide/nickel transport system permease protein